MTLKTEDVHSFEEALSALGFGKYQWMLLLVSGLTYLSYAYQNGLGAYIIPAAQCDLHMTSDDKGVLNAVFIIGGMVSAVLWGVLADNYGRRKILVISLLMDGVITATSSLSQTFAVLLVFRFCNGFVMAAAGSISLIYLAECMGPKYRSRCVVLMGAFFTCTWILLPLVSIAVLPITWKYETDNFKYNSWRIFVLVACAPSVASAVVLFFFFPESPKFLYSRGEVDKALEIMEKIYVFNFGQSKGSFPVRSIREENNISVIKLRNVADPTDVVHEVTKDKSKILKSMLSERAKQMITIFRKPHLRVTLITNSLMFSVMFGYYGLGLWFPEVFARFEDHYRRSNDSVTVCQLSELNSHQKLDPNLDGNLKEENYCQEIQENISAFINTLLMGTVCAIGNVLFTLVEKRAGLKLLTILTLFLSGCSALAVYFVNTTTTNLIVSCLFLTVAEVASMVIQSATCNLYPTEIRGLAGCVAWLTGRAGAVASNLIVGSFIDNFCQLPIFLMVATLWMGAAVGFFLPKKFDDEGNKKIVIKL